MNVREKQTKREEKEEKEERKQVFHWNTFYEIDLECVRAKEMREQHKKSGKIQR